MRRSQIHNNNTYQHFVILSSKLSYQQQQAGAIGVILQEAIVVSLLLHIFPGDEVNC